MTLAQLTGRHIGLRQELAAAYSALPWNARRLDRLSKDIARTDWDITGVKASAGADVQPVLCPQSSHSWLGMFAAHLIQLHPSMNAASAVKYAVASFRHAKGLDPLRAAELMASGEPFVKAETARPAATQRAPQSARYKAMFATHA